MKPITTRWLSVLLILMAVTASAQQVWNFQVSLDGKPIGTHRFEVETSGTSEAATQTVRTVLSNAEFAVTLFGITVYRYRHQATEQWQGDCLRELTSTTHDGSKQLQVSHNSSTLPNCIMSYAYWNPLLLQQKQLVNAQTGKIDQVTISKLEAAQIEVRGKSVPAQRWRISGLDAPIDLWYGVNDSSQALGSWLGLDAHPDGKLLSYRLQ